MLLSLLLVACQPDRPTSFLVISLDTFRADRIGRIGPDGASLTPNLDALAAESVVFTQTFAASNETLFSHAALFTGQPASRQGTLDSASFQLSPQTPTLAGQLARAGFWTEAIVAGGHLSPVFGLNTGFRRYVSMADWASFQQTAPPAIARLSWLSDREQPFMLLVHGYDTHTPYPKAGPLYRAAAAGYDGPLLNGARDADLYEQLYDGWWYPDYRPGEALAGPGQGSGVPLSVYRTDPDVSRHQLTDADMAFLTGAYDLSAAHADAWVGALLAALDDKGLAESTVVVVLGDHGEDLMEEGWFNHRHALSDITLHVPLLLRIPGQSAAVIDTPVSLTDVAPTLLALVEQPVPSDWTGIDLLGTLPDRPILSESPQGLVSIRTADVRLTTTRDALSALFPSMPGDRSTLRSADGSVRPWAEAAELWPVLQEAL
ncbi:MAG: arylsulfatase A-like enzyme [Myxococcota bacterium]|jgi:arylsulfatase A-like enzyme